MRLAAAGVRGGDAGGAANNRCCRPAAVEWRKRLVGFCPHTACCPLIALPADTAAPSFPSSACLPCSDNVEDALAKLQEILDAAWKAVQPIEEDPEKAKEIKKQVRSRGCCLSWWGCELAGLLGVRLCTAWHGVSRQDCTTRSGASRCQPGRCAQLRAPPAPPAPPAPQLERGNERRLQSKKMQGDKKKERRAKIDW